jgi:hypothetical protein
MPDVLDKFRHIESFDMPNLYARYEELKEGLKKLPDGSVDPSAMEDDTKLQEMCVILAQLRRRSAGPPKARKPGSGRGPKAGTEAVAPTLDEL